MPPPASVISIRVAINISSRPKSKKKINKKLHLSLSLSLSAADENHADTIWNIKKCRWTLQIPIDPFLEFGQCACLAAGKFVYCTRGLRDIRLPKTRHAWQKRELQQGNSSRRARASILRYTCVSSPVEVPRRDGRLCEGWNRIWSARAEPKPKEVRRTVVPPRRGRERLHLSASACTVKGEHRIIRVLVDVDSRIHLSARVTSKLNRVEAAKRAKFGQYRYTSCRYIAAITRLRGFRFKE